MTFEDYIKEHGSTDLDPDQLQQNQSILDQELSAEERKARERARASALMSNVEDTVKDGSATLFQVLTATLELCGLLTHNPDWSDEVLDAILKKYTDPDDPDHKLDTGLKDLATAEEYAAAVRKSLLRQSKKLQKMQMELDTAARDLDQMAGEPLDMAAKVRQYKSGESDQKEDQEPPADT